MAGGCQACKTLRRPSCVEYIGGVPVIAMTVSVVLPMLSLMYCLMQERLENNNMTASGKNGA